MEASGGRGLDPRVKSEKETKLTMPWEVDAREKKAGSSRVIEEKKYVREALLVALRCRRVAEKASGATTSQQGAPGHNLIREEITKCDFYTLGTKEEGPSG